MLPVPSHAPALRGGLIALAAALLFGLSTPLVQRFGAGLGAFTTAALLYAGAALASLLMRQPVGREARLRRTDLTRIVAMAGFGAVLGPVALAWGLQHTSGASASLLLTTEALFTALLAWWMYGETVNRRIASAMLLLLVGGLVLVVEKGLAGNMQLSGMLAVLVATVAWGVDNTLSRAVAERDPGDVVLVKAGLGAGATTAMALLVGDPLPGVGAGLALVAIGSTGYGLSLRLYLLAQREFGAARTGSVFAFAPFVGAAGAFALGERSGTWMLVLGGALMLAGVVLHLFESHGHIHDHDELAHEHAHTHDDGHHGHTHAESPVGSHSHLHRHVALSHQHPHAPDAHHRHKH